MLFKFDYEPICLIRILKRITNFKILIHITALWNRHLGCAAISLFFCFWKSGCNFLFLFGFVVCVVTYYDITCDNSLWEPGLIPIIIWGFSYIFDCTQIFHILRQFFKLFLVLFEIELNFSFLLYRRPGNFCLLGRFSNTPNCLALASEILLGN